METFNLSGIGCFFTFLALLSQSLLQLRRVHSRNDRFCTKRPAGCHFKSDIIDMPLQIFICTAAFRWFGKIPVSRRRSSTFSCVSRVPSKRSSVAMNLHRAQGLPHQLRPSARGDEALLVLLEPLNSATLPARCQEESAATLFRCLWTCVYEAMDEDDSEAPCRKEGQVIRALLTAPHGLFWIGIARPCMLLSEAARSPQSGMRYRFTALPSKLHLALAQSRPGDCSAHLA